MKKHEPRARRAHQHNFLEDLVISGLLEGRAVPAESGVQFYVGQEISEKGCCLLFELDWKGNPPLFPADAKKADYLSLFLPPLGQDWIATVIEMKGREQHNQRDGLDQIRSSLSRLRSEVQECLPGRPRIHWQGLLLVHQNCQIPREELKLLRNVAIVIAHHRVDLQDYVCQQIGPQTNPNPRSRGKNASPDEVLRPLERALMRGERSHSGPASKGAFAVQVRSLDGTLDLGCEPGRAWELRGERELCAQLREEHCPGT